MIVAAVTEAVAVWLGLAVALLAVGGKVWATCTQVLRWMNRQEDRWTAVDAWVQDWAERGLTPAGAVKEATEVRQLVNVHTSAISDVSARVDAHDQRIDHLAVKVDEIGKGR